MNCNEFTDLMPLYLEECLDEARRNEWREHLEKCAECREVALEEDPSLLFVLGTLPPVDSKDVERCVRNISALVRQEKLRRRIHRPQRWWYAAAAAVLLMISAGVFHLHTQDPANLKASAETQPIVAAVSEEEIQPPSIDVEMAHKALRVYQFANSNDGNSAAYFIVDEDMEL